MERIDGAGVAKGHYCSGAVNVAHGGTEPISMYGTKASVSVVVVKLQGEMQVHISAACVVDGRLRNHVKHENIS